MPPQNITMEMSNLSNEEIAALVYALDMYESEVTGANTSAFIESFYKLRNDARTEYTKRRLEWTLFWKYEI